MLISNGCSTYMSRYSVCKQKSICASIKIQCKKTSARQIGAY